MRKTSMTPGCEKSLVPYCVAVIRRSPDVAQGGPTSCRVRVCSAGRACTPPGMCPRGGRAPRNGSAAGTHTRGTYEPPPVAPEHHRQRLASRACPLQRRGARHPKRQPEPAVTPARRSEAARARQPRSSREREPAHHEATHRARRPSPSSDWTSPVIREGPSTEKVVSSPGETY